MLMRDLKPNMRIIATRNRGPCWKIGDKFTVRKTIAGDLAIECWQSAKHGVHPLRTDAEMFDFEVDPT